MEEKRIFIAFALTLVLMMVYMQLTRPPVRSVTSTNTTSYEKSTVQALPPTDIPQPVAEAEGEATESLEQATIGEYDIFYCSKGAYIKKIRSRKYNEELPFFNIGLISAQKNLVFQAETQNGRLIFTNKNGVRKTFIFDGDRLQVVLNPAQEDLILLFSNPLSHNGIDERYMEFFYAQRTLFERKNHQSLIPQPGLMAKLFQKAQPVTELDLQNVKFAGARGRYFCLALTEGDYSIKWIQNPSTKEIFLYSKPKEGQAVLYLGLQNKENMQLFGLQGVIFYGTFHGVGVVILNILSFFARVFHNWGLAVILFGIFTYILLLPLTRKSTLAMKEMRDFQEQHGQEMKNLREKYRDNPQKMQQELLEIYKKNNFSPFKGCSSGCLPLILQLPLIWAFWAVVPRMLDLRNAGFLWIKDLSAADKLFILPFSLPLGIGNAINILPIATAVLMFYQMKLTNPPSDPEQAQQQKIMSTIFPVMLIFFLYNLPSALLLYWFVQSVLTFISQWKMMRP